MQAKFVSALGRPKAERDICPLLGNLRSRHFGTTCRSQIQGSRNASFYLGFIGP